MRDSHDFNEKLELGRRYEMAMSNWLQQAAHFGVIPTYDYTGSSGDKAPRMHCGTRGLVLPDIWAARNGDLRWFEVKWKNTADLYRKTNTMVTGIPLRNWQHYREVKQMTHIPVYLVFIHQNEGKVVFEELDSMPVSHTYEGSKMSKNGMIFFNFEKLRTLMLLEQLERYMEAN